MNRPPVPGRGGVACHFLLVCGLAWGPLAGPVAAEGGAALRVASFDVDVTPPVGGQMAYDPVVAHWDLGLRARGLLLEGGGLDRPVVVCAIDWIGIGNEGHDRFRQVLAGAAGTTADHVAVHTVHQHDAPACDFSAEAILREAGLEPLGYDGTFAREALGRLEGAVAGAMGSLQGVTHVGFGNAMVHQVASNRRILGADGRVRVTRYTATADPAVRAEPEGLIDPMVSVVSLWAGDRPLAVLSYYAVHPQSYYRTGVPNPDFPGVARFLRQMAVPEALHIHFAGAGGNLGAGKYNDGSRENRLRLAERLADGMRRAWERSRREVLAPGDAAWVTTGVVLAPAAHLSKEGLEAGLKGRDASFFLHGGASRLAWLQRVTAGHRLDMTCLGLGPVRILHFPGELFVEYQLAARELWPDRGVAVAAYGDYGPGYIGTAVAYEQGGYETSPQASNVDARAEAVLMEGMRRLRMALP